MESEGSDPQCGATLETAGAWRRVVLSGSGRAEQKGKRGRNGICGRKSIARRERSAGRGLRHRGGNPAMTTATVSKEVTYLEAISQALDEEMSRDERVFLMGEDIGIYGGAFRITEGFLQKFGEWRVLDTPLSESGFVGAAIGAAM